MYMKRFQTALCRGLMMLFVIIIPTHGANAVDPFVNATDAPTFSAAAVGRMETYYEEHKIGSNAPEDCITIMNGAIRQLLSDQNQTVGSAVHLTINRLASDEHVTERRDIEYKDASGRNTRGITKPDSARESVATVARSACAQSGRYVFGLSVADGYHSMTLAVDNSTKQPKYFLADQNDGWVERTSATLDSEILDWTKRAWDSATPTTRPRTRTTLWRLIP